MIRLIVAIDAKRGLADDQGIPWQGRLPSDARYFRDRTAEGLVVMGFRTYEEFAGPLHDRTNYVVARPGGPPLRDGFRAVEDLDRFLAGHGDDTIWIIGGGALYERTLPVADELDITQLDQDFHCTKFFPRYEGDFTVVPGSETRHENGIAYRFEIWHRIRTA